MGHVACMKVIEKCIKYFGWKIWREETTQKR